MKSACLVLQGHYEIDIRVKRKAEALVANGYHVDVLALRSPYSKSDEYSLDGVNVYTVSLGKERGSLIRYAYEYAAFFLWTAFRLPGLMRRHRYSIIDVNTLPDFLIFSAAYAKWKGAKLILDMHEITPEFYISKYSIDERAWVIRLLKRVERVSMCYADHVITINEPIQALLESRGLGHSSSTVIMNSADESLFFDDSNTPPPRHLDDAKASFVFMYHGTLTRIYGLDIAIEAFAMAQQSMPGSEFWIIGGGTERAALEQLATQLGVGPRVKFVGTVLPQEVHHWLCRSDAGVLATRQDVFLDYSFSNKLSEYIIVGKPVIASRLRTINHYFSDSALAFFVPGDRADLAAKMTMIFGDKARRASLVQAASRELDPIRWSVMKSRYLRLVEDLVLEAAAFEPQT